MNNKVSTIVIVLGFLILSGCAAARLYPVQGPMAAQTPMLVLKATLKGAFNSGSISVVLPGGEVCKGKWDVVHDPNVSKKMESVWDTVYGQDFYQSHVLGAEYAQAEATGGNGTKMNLAMYKPSTARAQKETPMSIRGVATDNNGNIYKIVF